jgi:hypothetical protein
VTGATWANAEALKKKATNVKRTRAISFSARPRENGDPVAPNTDNMAIAEFPLRRE